MALLVSTLWLGGGDLDVFTLETAIVTQSGIVDGRVFLGTSGDGQSVLIVDGLVTGAVLGFASTSRDHTIWVGASGRLDEIQLAGSGHRVNNAGSISNFSNSNIAVFFDEFGGTSIRSGNILNNSGLISTQSNLTLSPSYTITAAELSTFATVINNSGTISSASNRAVSLGIASDEVRNSGLIIGEVKLGGGNDRLENTGTLSGAFDAGDGDDKLINSGTMTGAVSLGGGYDELESAGEIFGNVSFGTGGGVFLNTGTVRGNVSLGSLGDFGFLDSSLGAIFGSITGGGAGNNIKTSNVGNAVFGGSGFDTVRGGTGDDTISTFDGGDLLLGGGGDDKLNGGTGADTMAGGTGDDEYTVDSAGDFVTEVRQGGNGYDFVRVEAGVSFDLSNKAQARGEIEDLFMDGLTFLENINGTGNALDNTITGNGGINTLDGRGGDDELFGAAGNDMLIGGTGDDILRGMDANDTLIGGAGADLMDGDAGSDTANYASAATGVNVALNGSFGGTGDALGDTFVSVENLIGSAFSDTLRGTNGANIISAGAGNDRIEGLTGIDTLTGGAGNDTFFFNQPTDGADVITDFGSTATTNDDRFEIRGSNFDNLPVGPLLAGQFQSSTFDTAQTATVRFFHETDTGKLFYDRDGNGGAFGPQLLATLQLGAVVAIGDFTII